MMLHGDYIYMSFDSQARLQNPTIVLVVFGVFVLQVYIPFDARKTEKAMEKNKREIFGFEITQILNILIKFFNSKTICSQK